jgi:WD40 repeat protein
MLRTKLLVIAAGLTLGLFPLAGTSGGQTPPAVNKDAHGDPIPAGALNRLGTVRWRHGGITGFVAFGPDGKTVLSAADDRVLRLWEYPSGKEIRRFGPQANDDPNTAFGRFVYYGQNGLPVAVTKDGKVAACNFDSSDILLYDVTTGKELPALKNNGNFRGVGFSGAMQFSPDGEQLAVLEYDSSIRIWDWAKGKEIRHFNIPAGNNVFGGNPVLTYSPDGKLVATVNLELVNNMVSYSVKLWDPARGQEVRSLPLPQNTGAMSPVFSPDSKTLAYGAYDGSITLVEVETGKEIRKIEDNQRRSMNSLTFSPDGKSLFVRSYGNVPIREVEVASGKELRVLGNGAKVGPIRFGNITMVRPVLSPGGDALALVGLDHGIHFMDVASGKEVHGDEGHAAPIFTVAFSESGKAIWTQSNDGMIRRWDPASGKENSPIKMPVNAFSATFSRDGKFLVTQPVGVRGIQVLDAATGQELGNIQPPNRGFYANMAFAPDDKTLAVRFQQGSSTIDLYDLPAGQPQPAIFGNMPLELGWFGQKGLGQVKLRRTLSINTGQPEPGVIINGPITIAPPTMIFSPDSRMLAAYSDPSTLTIWDTVSGKKITSLPPTNKSQILSGAFSRDGRCLALDRNDGTVVLWELATGKERRVFGKQVPPAPNNGFIGGISYGGPNVPHGDKLAFSPDSKHLVHAGFDRVVHIWDIASGAEVVGLSGHTGMINGVAFAPDGKTLVSGSSDTTALLWDVAKLGARPLAKNVLPAAEAQARWQALKGGDAQKAFAAICELVASPIEAVACLKAELKPAPGLDMKEVQRLIAQLDDNNYKTRQKAYADLLRTGDRAVPAIEKALASNPPLEAKRRLDDLHEKLTSAILTDEKLQVYRAVEVLERIGTPEARELLETLASGAPGAFSTTSAEAALKRIK